MYLGTSYIYWDLSIYSKNKSRVRGYAARLKTKYEVMEAYLELIWGVDSGNKVLYTCSRTQTNSIYLCE